MDLSDKIDKATMHISSIEKISDRGQTALLRTKIEAQIALSNFIEQEKKNGHFRRGKPNAQGSDIMTFEQLGIDRKRVPEWKKIAKLPPEKLAGFFEECEANSIVPTQNQVLELAKGNAPITNNVDDDEWYTPLIYIEAARKALGSIDCDPATCDFMQERIDAKTFFTADNSGLDHEWHGNVWLNPPYSRELLSKFIDKLICEYSEKRTSQAILLTHNYTDSKWWQTASEHSSAWCFPNKRIVFEKTDGRKSSPTCGQVFHYFGKKPDNFIKVFSQFGTCGKPA